MDTTRSRQNINTEIFHHFINTHKSDVMLKAEDIILKAIYDDQQEIIKQRKIKLTIVSSSVQRLPLPQLTLRFPSRVRVARSPLLC